MTRTHTILKVPSKVLEDIEAALLRADETGYYVRRHIYEGATFDAGGEVNLKADPELDPKQETKFYFFSFRHLGNWGNGLSACSCISELIKACEREGKIMVGWQELTEEEYDNAIQNHPENDGY